MGRRPEARRSLRSLLAAQRLEPGPGQGGGSACGRPVLPRRRPAKECSAPARRIVGRARRRADPWGAEAELARPLALRAVPGLRQRLPRALGRGSRAVFTSLTRAPAPTVVAAATPAGRFRALFVDAARGCAVSRSLPPSTASAGGRAGPPAEPTVGAGAARVPCRPRARWGPRARERRCLSPAIARRAEWPGEFAVRAPRSALRRARPTNVPVRRAFLRRSASRRAHPAAQGKRHPSAAPGSRRGH